MRRQLITIISFFVILSSLYSQTSGLFNLQKAAAEALKVVNPTYLAAYGLGQVMAKNIGAMSNHWRATREAIENTDNYTRDNRHPKEIPFSFINYEPDRLQLLKHFRNLEYFAELINKSYNKNKIDLFIKEIKKVQNKINGIFVQYRGEPYFISREDAINKIEKKNTKNETIYNSVVGNWAWFNGGVITLTKNGKITYKGKAIGTYTFSGGTCNLTWYKGKFVDKLDLINKGMRLEGKNQNGTTVWGNRMN